MGVEDNDGLTTHDWHDFEVVEDEDDFPHPKKNFKATLAISTQLISATQRNSL